MNHARKLLLVLALLAMMMLGVIVVSAQQDAETITLGDTVNGTLSDTLRRALYLFEGQADVEVTITLTSDDFDSYLLLLDANGDVLVEDDDSAGRLDSQIVFTLPDDAEYTIVATSLREFSSNGEFFQEGDFTLALNGDGTSTPNNNSGDATPTPTSPTSTPQSQQNQTQQSTEPGTIGIGDTIEGTLTQDDPRLAYAFDGTANQEVTITLISEDFDSYLLLLDENGSQVAEDDDSAGRLDSQIIYTLEADGTYTIIATSLREVRSEGSEFAPGDFTLSLSADGSAPDNTQPDSNTTTQPPNADGTIALGDTVEGTLDGASTGFTFDGSAGQTITITATSTDFDTYLQLVNAGGDILAEDDDSAGRLNAQVVYTIEEDGAYTILVTSYRAVTSGGTDTAGGDFTLALSSDGTAPDNNQTDNNTTTQPPSADGTIAIGDTVSGTLTEASAALTFEGTAGQDVTITLSSTDFDPYLQLQDTEGNLYAEDDDSAGQLNAQITYRLPEDGTYTIIVTSFRAVSSEGDLFGEGDYTLSVSADGAPVTQTDTPTTTAVEAISIGDTVSGSLTENTPSIDYTFEAAAGDLISITMIAEDFDTYLLLLDADGTEIQRDDDSAGNLDSRIGPYSITESGTYTITATSYGSSNDSAPATGSFTLSLATATVDPIEYTQTVEGAISSITPISVYRFTGTAGDIVSLDLTTDSFSVYARLTGGTTNVQGYGGTEILGPYVLPETGDYVITITSYDTTTDQPYNLTLNRIDPVAISYGYRARSSFAEEGQDVLYYSIEGAIGDTITVIVQSQGTVDTRLSLIGPDGFEVASDDDGGQGFDPELRYQVTEDGTYQLVIRSYIPGDDGTFNLIVENASVPDLVTGETQIVRLSDKQYLGTLVFEGTAGETIQLGARLLTTVNSEPRITVTQNGVTLADQSIGRVSNLMFEFVVPEDGRIEVAVQDYNGNPVVIEFTLARPAAEAEGE